MQFSGMKYDSIKPYSLRRAVKILFRTFFQHLLICFSNSSQTRTKIIRDVLMLNEIENMIARLKPPWDDLISVIICGIFYKIDCSAFNFEFRICL